MSLIDIRLRHHLGRYIFQCGLATLTVMAVLHLLDAVYQTAIIASIGASAFLVFAAPKAYTSRPRSLLGGYAAGIVTGVFCALVGIIIGIDSAADWGIEIVILGGAAVGLAIFWMTVTDTEHPPAAGIALALVLNPWSLWTLLVILGAVAILTLVRIVFGRVLYDLF
jgi:CBS-domain-containing membrane protein